MAKINTIIQIGATGIQRLTTEFGVQAIKPIQGTGKNPYEGKTGQAPVLDEPLYTSVLGTPIYCDLTFGDTFHPDRNNIIDQNGKVWKVKPMVFATILLSIDQTKEIVKTAVPGLNGRVKEYIGMDDYQVTINGIIPGANGIYPRSTVSQFKQLLEINAPIPVTSWWLQLFDIHYLVIENFNIPQLAGEQSQQSFSINALSDIPLEIQYIP